MTRYSVLLIALALLALAVCAGPTYGSHIAPDRAEPAPPQDHDLPAIVLADRADGLELVSAPITLSLTLGHVAYLPVEVQGYHRPITVSAQTLIHTYVNDVMPAEPGAAPAFVAGRLDAAQGELKLQTLRMREHPLVLTFSAGDVEHENTKERETHEARSHEDATAGWSPFASFTLRTLRPLRAFVVRSPYSQLIFSASSNCRYAASAAAPVNSPALAASQSTGRISTIQPAS